MNNLFKHKVFGYAVPIIVFILASVQFVQTRKGLTRWKGGGFGMYTELNFPHREVWIVLPDTSMNLDKVPDFKKKHQELIRKVQRYPNPRTIAPLSAALAKSYTDSFNIQVWLPYVDAANQKWCKRLIYD